MNKILLSLLLPWLSLLAEEESPYMTSECDTYALIDGVVNAYNGKLIQIDQDIQTLGVDPVEMVRYYDGGHHFDSEFGYGVGCSYPALIEIMENPKYVKVELRQGLDVLCEVTRRKELETKKSGAIYTGSVAKLYYKKGYTNCPTHLLQGEPSLFALQIRFEGEKAVVTLGDGTKRHYKAIPGSYYRLVEEELPSGNRRHYFYTSSLFPFALTDICTTNREGSLNLNWLKFSETKDGVLVTASNGQQANYTLEFKTGKISKGNLFRGMKGKFEKELLMNASCDHFPSIEYSFIKHTESFHTLFSIFQVKSAGRSLEVEYDSKERVKTLKSSASALPLYTFSYHAHHTDVIDANGAKKTYQFSDRRPISLIEPHRTQNFLWDERGQLISHTTHTPDGAKQCEQTYSYDIKGNVVETHVIGNITACGSWDSQKTQFQYDQTSNHLVSIKRHNHETLFSYVPETNLVARKLTLYNHVCEEREFYHYDKNGIQILKIVDDGSGTDANDFTNMTYRLITEIEPQVNPALPGMTLPRLTKEFYLDLATHKRHALKTTECLYTQGDSLAEKRIFDAEGAHCYTLFYEYNKRGELIRETNALGESTLYAYDDVGNKISEEKKESGKKTCFTYDLANRLIEEKEIHSDRSLIKNDSYDAMGNQLTETDIYGRTTHKKYDLASREILSIDPLGYTEEKIYDVFGNVILTKDKDGYQTKTIYNTFKKPLAIVYPDGIIERFAYDLAGHLVKEWKRDEQVLCHKLDYKGRIIQTDFLSKEGTHLKTLQFIYKGPHLVEEIDALGNKTEYRYDGAGRKIEKVQESNVIQFTYDPLGRLTKTITDSLCTCIEYDSLDRKIEERIEDLSRNIYCKVQFEYDILGNETVQRNFINASEFSEKRTIFNSQSLPILEVDPLGFEKQITYTQTDHLEKETIDALGRRFLEVYDKQNQLQEQKTFSNTGVLLDHHHFIYDGRGNSICRTDQIVRNGTPTSSYEIKTTFDSMNQKVLEVEQGSKVTKMTYAQGKLVKLIQPDSSTISYLYDSLNRLIEQTASDHTVHNIFAYDLNDNVLLANNCITDSSVERRYDSKSRIIYEKQSSGLEFFYSYDSLDRIKEMQFCDALVTYDYSPTCLLSSSRYQGGKLLYSCTQKCNWKGKVIEASFNGIPCTYTWDLAGRCTQIETPSYKQNLSYDSVGNLIASNGKDAIGSFDERFIHNDLNQLIQEPDLEYTYDSLHNRHSTNEIKASLNGFNQITNNGEETYSYDANGRRTHKNAAQFTYDALGHLLSFKQGSQDIAYQYDAFGRRTQCIKEDQAIDYLYQFDTEIGCRNQEIIEFRLIHNSFATVALEFGNDIYFPIRNHRGDICQLLNTKGSPKSTYRYDAFGNASKEGSITSPWLFSGKRYESATGLYHFDNRDYDPHLGRWLTCDPLGFADGPNLYAYVHNNPLIYIDPYGLWREESRDFLHGLSRGAIDDTTWNASSALLGTYEPGNNFDRVGYHVGTAGSLIGGLFYGGTELKIAKGAATLFRRMLQKSQTQSIKTISSIKAVSKIDKAQVSTTLAKMPEKLAIEKNKTFVNRATSLAGSKRAPLEYAPHQKIRNEASIVNGRNYTGHALDRMQDRGLMPSVIENTINTGRVTPAGGHRGLEYYDSVNRIKVIVGENGNIITIIPGRG